MQLTDQTTCSCHFGSSSAQCAGPLNERSSNADNPRNRFIIFPDTAVRQVITQRMNILRWLRSLNPANPGNKPWGVMPTTLTEETVQEADGVLSQLLLELRERFVLHYYTLVCDQTEQHARQEQYCQICVFFRCARWMPFYCLERRTSCNNWHEPVDRLPWWAPQCGSDLSVGDLYGDLRKVFLFHLGQRCSNLVRVLLHASYLRIFLNALGDAEGGDAWCHGLADDCLNLAVQGAGLLHSLLSDETGQ
ncbi:hypothetical protein EDB80DRAFT_733249 [Ilyonectria destructans]|nr:hypothetical protein EDB80DRAFT_733249 [Ilyonectria destructans]